MTKEGLPPAHEADRRRGLLRALAAEVGAAQAQALAKRALADAHREVGDDAEALHYARQAMAQEAALSRLQEVVGELTGEAKAAEPPTLYKRLRAWGEATIGAARLPIFLQHVDATTSTKGAQLYHAVAWTARTLREFAAPDELCGEVNAWRMGLLTALPGIDDVRRCLDEIRASMPEGDDRNIVVRARDLLGPVGSGKPSADTLTTARTALATPAYPIGHVAALAQALNENLARIEADAVLG